MKRFRATARGAGAAVLLFFGCSMALQLHAAGGRFHWIVAEEERGRLVAEARLAEPDEIEAWIFFDPDTRGIVGTARLCFHSPAGPRSFAFDDGLAIDDVLAPGVTVRLFRRDHRVYLAGDGLQRLLVCFSGLLPPWDVQNKQLASLPEEPAAGRDRFLTLQSDGLPFIPCSRLRFSRSRVTVFLPARFNCLGSGVMEELAGSPGVRAFFFDTISSRGFSFTCGDFKRLGRVEGSLPVNFYGAPQLERNPCRDEKKIRQTIDFFASRFGRLDVPELNVLFCRAGFHGGVSHPGCIVCFFNPEDAGKRLEELDDLRQESPVFLHDPRCDCLVHEIAHQWWGGLCSGNNCADCWITEGLAQFSTLLYLRGQLPEAELDPIMERMAKWVERHDGVGKVTDSLRLGMVNRDTRSLQAIVYDRAALILWMLRELKGEEKMLARLRDLLTERRYTCWSTPAFIDWMAGNDPLLLGFFSSWIERADLPDIRCSVSSQGQTVHVAVEQVNGPFVFPLQFVSYSAAGKRVRPLVVSREREEYSFLLSEIDSPVLRAGVSRGYVPVRVTLR
jgi:hypothetical protein